MSNILVHSVDELLNILDKLQFQFGQRTHGSSFIFRGMSDKNWPLIPSIFRQYSEPQMSSLIENGSISGSIYASNENEILAHFKKEASGILPHIRQNDDFTWLQYAQHYGVPTRLLDFTSNPLIALYFCCKTESKEDGSIWILNSLSFLRWMQSDPFCERLGLECTRDAMISSILKSLKGFIDYREENITMQLPVLFIPAYIDQRMNAQSSRFLLWGKEKKPLDQMVNPQNFMQLSKDNTREEIFGDQKFLMKIEVYNHSKHNIIRQLDVLGVNDMTIFPGLDGIGRYIENYYKNNADDIFEFF